MRVSKIAVNRNGLVGEVLLSNGEPLEGIINAGLHMEPNQPIQLVLYVDMDDDAFQVVTDLAAGAAPAGQALSAGGL